MKVYPKLIIYCPKTRQEQTGEECKSCKFYYGYGLAPDELYIDCEIKDEISMDSYQ